MGRGQAKGSAETYEQQSKENLQQKFCGLRRMGHNNAADVCMSDEVECSETTIEIKIKTLDSQTYSLRVDKQMPVPDLKDQIASITGVLSEQQRLICRGKVLKDDQLLSAYHVEDGHTLHLVVRQPPVVDGLSNNPASDPDTSTSARQGRQVGPNVVIEALSLPEQAEGSPAEITRILSALLGSFGIPSSGFSPEAVEIRGQNGRAHSISSEIPAAVPLGSLPHPVIVDSLATLTQYRSHLSREFDAIGRDRGNNAQAARTEDRESNSAPMLGTVQGLPTPASLAEVLLSTRQMLTEQAGEGLLQLGRQLENQVNVTDPLVRSSLQSSAWRTGSLLHNLGAFLLELGRATMTLRLGQSPSEAVVNAGPAVFISPSGPNPLMVQPFPFHSGTSFGSIPMGTMQPTSVLGNGVGLPRGRIDIQIRRGSSTSIPNANGEEDNTRQPLGNGNLASNSGGENVVNQATSGFPEGSSFVGEQGVRLLPMRTMAAAIPSSISGIHSESSGNSMGLYYPVLGRVEHVTSGLLIRRQGSQPSDEHHPTGTQTEQQPIPQSTARQEHTEDQPRDGSLPSLGQHARSVNISILSTGGISSNQESEGQIPGSVMHLLRSLFPGGEIHVENANSHGTTNDSGAQHTETSPDATNSQESEPRASDEGIFFSNLLREIMPFISQIAGTESSFVSTEETNASAQRTAQDSSTVAENSDVGTSRRNGDLDPIPPNSKRQKRE